MYLIRRENTVIRRGPAEAHFGRLGELQSTKPGFQFRAVLNSLGYPAKFATLARWESREAEQAFASSTELAAFSEANPTGSIFTASRPAEAYEFVLGVGEPELKPGVFMTLVEWTINLGAAADFERTRKEIFELRNRGQKGFVTNRLWRFMGNPNRYLIIQGYTNREEVRAAQALPEIARFTMANPFSKYANVAPLGETYTILQAHSAGS